MAEFKRLSDVEVVAEPAESANVLIEENGVIKKASKTAVGGAGSEPDLVILLTAPAAITMATSDNTSVTIESGSLDAVAEALRAGRPPVVKCKRFYITNGFDTSYPVVEGGVYDCDVLYYNGAITFSFAIPRQYMARVIMDINDAEYLQVWFYPLVMTTIQVI